MPLAKLKKYAAAYSIRIDHAVEKDDVIDALLVARVSATLSSWTGLLIIYCRRRMDVYPRRMR